MKKTLSLLFVLCFTVFSFAQKTLSGKIMDDDGQPVPSASVTVEEPGKDAIIAYGISNSKGEYKVTFTSNESNVDVKVKAFNQKPLVRQVSNETQTVNFSLQSEATEIKEVKLKTKLITKKGDTISYDISEFDSKADRTLSDVLKKIPGIEVNSTGQILYQGEPISQFTVNGKNLMEGGYGAIVNSLPKDAVQKMEVMENHQPLKILQDKVPSDKAAINIKLKKSVTMTGRGETGVGLSPFLWNLKLTPMFFGQKSQWVLNYKTNNNGEAVENERNMLAFGNRWEGRRVQASQRNWLGVDKAGTPQVPEKRYLMNNVHYLSANLLTNPFKNKEWELKINSNYTNNTITRESASETVFDANSQFPNGKVTSERRNKFYDNELKGEVIFSKNAKKGFFKNTTTWNSFWNLDRGFIKNTDNTVRNENYQMDESFDTPASMFQNSLSTIIPFKEKLVNFMSYVSYQKDKQQLSTLYEGIDLAQFFGSGRNYSRLDQNLWLKTGNISHSASVGFSYKKWTFTPRVGLDLSFNDMESKLYGDRTLLENRFRNDITWNELNPYTALELSYKNSGLSLNINMPVNFRSIDYEDHITGVSKELSKTVFEPSVWMMYDFASFWKFSAFANLNYDFGDFGSVYNGEMFTSPLSPNVKNSSIPENRFITFGPRIEYRNPLNNLFFNVRYGYNQTKRNLIGKTSLISGSKSIFQMVDYDNITQSQSEAVEVGKYFPKYKTNLSLNFSNRDSNSLSLDFNDNLIENKSNGQSAGLKFNNTYFSWMSLDYNLSMNWNKNTNLFRNSTNKSSGWNHNLAAYFYPKENHTFGFFWDDMTSTQSNESKRNKFFDASYQYTWAKKKIDFELKWLNIGNNKVFETIGYDAVNLSTFRSAIQIRPSQVMFTVKFNFK